ncbi:hypothetical protein JOM56_009120 [Amanita muscaria]
MARDIGIDKKPKEDGEQADEMEARFTGQCLLDFVQTTRYQRPFMGVAFMDKDGSSYIVAPPSWEVYRHPNGDVYFYNPHLHLITPDDITLPRNLSLVIESWEDHMANMAYDRIGKKLGDDWELVLSDVSETSVMIEVISRNAGKAYRWSDQRGLEMWESKAHYWSLLSEYPSHHPDLPQGVEAEFVKRIHYAKAAVEQGRSCPLTRDQIEQVITRYQELKALQAKGQNVTPTLTWLMGVVMPLDNVSS